MSQGSAGSRLMEELGGGAARRHTSPGRGLCRPKEPIGAAEASPAARVQMHSKPTLDLVEDYALNTIAVPLPTAGKLVGIAP